MKTLIKLEEAFLFILSIYLFTILPYAWWWFPLLLFVPDLGMIGYVFNTKVGAYVYNIVHHRAISIIIYLIGSIITFPVLQLIGIILFAHSSLDRVFQYGFKYIDDFKHTHLE